jgi:phytoene synthase
LHCERLLRAGDRDRFLTALFAPAEHRAALFALYAFNLEIARTPEAARNPQAGEIRLQWWSDVLAGEIAGAGNPVSAALGATLTSYRLPIAPLHALIDARRFDLYNEPMRTVEELEAYADGAASSVFALAAHVLNAGREAGLREVTRHAGRAHAIAGLLNALPAHAHRGRLYVPREVLERCGSSRREVEEQNATPGLRKALAAMRRIALRNLDEAGKLSNSVPLAVLPAFLPLAVVGPMLARMQRPNYDPFVPIEIAPWRRQWLIWRAAGNAARMFR